VSALAAEGGEISERRPSVPEGNLSSPLFGMAEAMPFQNSLLIQSLLNFLRETCQGTTSVVPQRSTKDLGFSRCNSSVQGLKSS